MLESVFFHQGASLIKPVEICLESTRRLPRQLYFYPNRQIELSGLNYSALSGFPFLCKAITFHLCLLNQNRGDGYPHLSLSKNRDRQLGRVNLDMKYILI